MKFPIMNISIKEWDLESLELYLLNNKFIYTTNLRVYEKYYLGNLFIDINGNIYEIVGRNLPNKLIQFFDFIPNLCKVELVFKLTENKMTIEDLKQHVLTQVSKINEDDCCIEWVKTVEKAKTIEEIICA